MLSEVQAVLQEALRAQEYEDEGYVGLALESYYKAGCQLAYFVDLHVEKDSALAELCVGLGQQYEQRITVSVAPVLTTTVPWPHSATVCK
jgi:hypothetical protein